MRPTMSFPATIVRAACLILIALLLVTAAGCGGGDGDTDGAVEVSWSSPGRDAEVFGVARLRVEASSQEEISEVSFYCDTVDDAHRIGTVTDNVGSLYTQTWYTTEVANGEHTLHAVARDGQDRSEQASRTVTVGNISRAEALAEAVTWEKRTPQNDVHVLALSPAFSSIFYDPVPMEAPILSAGAEDSPFITPDGSTFYLFFTPDMNIPVTEQILDRVTGIYCSQKVGGAWTEPQRVWLNYCDDPSMDGAEAILGDTMWFASVRRGVKREIDLFSAELVDGRWTNWANLGEPLNVEYEVGELHISADGSQVFFHSKRAGGKGGMDIWVTSKVNGRWQTPQNVEAVNTQYDEGYPFLSEDGNELWFNRNYGVYRSLRVNGQWQAPELVVSPLAGEPTMDRAGNLYFVHHYYDDAADKIWEADIYVCRRR